MKDTFKLFHQKLVDFLPVCKMELLDVEEKKDIHPIIEFSVKAFDQLFHVRMRYIELLQEADAIITIRISQNVTIKGLEILTELPLDGSFRNKDNATEDSFSQALASKVVDLISLHARFYLKNKDSIAISRLLFRAMSTSIEESVKHMTTDKNLVAIKSFNPSPEYGANIGIYPAILDKPFFHLIIGLPDEDKIDGKKIVVKIIKRTSSCDETFKATEIEVASINITFEENIFTDVKTQMDAGHKIFTVIEPTLSKILTETYC